MSYGVATVSSIDQIIGLFCRIASLLLGSFAKEAYNLIDPTHRSHSICILKYIRVFYAWKIVTSHSPAAHAYAACPNLNVLVGALLEGGLALMSSRCTVTPGIAVKL